MPITGVFSSDMSADLLPDHTFRDRCITVSVFAVTSSIILIGYALSLLLSVCTVLSSSLYKLMSDVKQAELE